MLEGSSGVGWGLSANLSPPKLSINIGKPTKAERKKINKYMINIHDKYMIAKAIW